MKNVMTWLIAMVLCFAGSLSLTAPAHADMMNSQDAICTPNFAEWRNYSFDNGQPNPAAHQIAPQDGSLTTILVCKLGNHFVRINYLTEPANGFDCGQGDQGYVSAWVDGVKIVSRALFANDRADCRGNAPATVTSKIIVNNLMHLTVCHRADDGQGDERCTVVPLTLAGRPRDPIYDGPLVTTPATIDLITNADPVCKQIPADPSTLELPEQKAAGDWEYDPNKDFEANSKTFVVDLDNDGVADTVTRQASMFAGGDTVDFSWQNGKTKQSFEFDDITKLPSHVPSNFYAILRVENRNYLYGYSSPDQTCYLESLCKDRSSEDAVLYAVAGDGSGHELCRWRPRGKPEERL